MLTVLPVRDASEVRRFLDVGYRLYRDEARWIPPVRSDLHARVRMRRNPFWKRADGRMFIARRGHSMVGRVTVHLDATGAVDRATALFGFFEADDDKDVVRALLDAARRWAAAEGVERLLGPASFTALEEAGVLVEGHDTPASFLSPWQPAFYERLLRREGLEADGLLEVVRLPVGNGRRRVDAAERVRAVGRAVVARAGELDTPVHGHPALWPPTVEEVEARFRRLRPYLDRRVLVSGPAGVAAAVPDLNEVLVRLRGSLGPAAAARMLRDARRDRRGLGVAFLAGDPDQLLEELLARARGAGYEHVEVTVRPGTATATAADRLGGRVIRRYRTFSGPVARA